MIRNAVQRGENVRKRAQKAFLELQISRSEPTELCRRSHTKAVFSELINWLDLFMAPNHERINQTINSLIACLRSGRRILICCPSWQVPRLQMNARSIWKSFSGGSALVL